ncbi:MAG TPA: biopolymer transporter ExbD, partial [Polyangiaceae bacterium]|nr:biopolymer transporter ExbD [Polyangiaceae bacterium]
MGVSLGGGGKKGKKTTALPAINITPLVDVVLVVLIIFMIVTPMVTKTFWLNLPPKDDKSEPAPPSDNKPLVMTVDKAGVIRINTTVLSKQEVRER